MTTCATCVYADAIKDNEDKLFNTIECVKAKGEVLIESPSCFHYADRSNECCHNCKHSASGVTRWAVNGELFELKDHVECDIDGSIWARAYKCRKWERKA